MEVIADSLKQNGHAFGKVALGYILIRFVGFCEPPVWVEEAVVTQVPILVFL